MAITPLPTPPSRADAANFSDRADAFMAQLPTFANEANALQADVNAKQSTASTAATTATTKASEASTSATTATTKASEASTSATNAAASATTAQNWAIKTDGPVTGSEYSAKYWGQIAQGFVVGTLIDDANTSSVKVWSSNKVSTWAAGKTTANTFSAQNKFSYTGGNNATITSYSVVVPDTGGYCIQGSTGHVGLYATSGTFRIGFGGDSTITSKYSFTESGDFTAVGRVTSNGVTSSSTGLFAGSLQVSSGGSEASLKLSTDYGDCIVYNNHTGYGIYNQNAQPLITYNRSTNKVYISSIPVDDIWTTSRTTFIDSFGGRIRLPNGYIRQWGSTSVSSNSSQLVTFSLAFPNTVIGCNLTISDTSTSPTYAVTYKNLNTQGVHINNTNNRAVSVFYEVVGY